MPLPESEIIEETGSSLDILSDESDDEPTVDEVLDEPDEPEEEESSDEEEPEEEEEDEDELEEPDEEELEDTDEDDELVLPVRRQEILKEFPKIFEKFPYLEKALYKTQQFEEVYSTPEDAKEAATALTEFKQLETQLIESGKLTPILKAVKDADERSFYKLADGYLESLRETDQNTYLHVAGNIISDTVRMMAHEGQTQNNDVLKQAAQILNQFAFGSSQFVPPTKLSKEDPNSEERSAIQRQQEEFVQHRFEVTRDDLDGRVKSKINAYIKTNIDPKESMTDYVRRTASREVFESVQESLSNDSEFQSLMNRLWEKAFDSNFSKQSTDKIFSAYNTKAKLMLPKLIKKARVEALKGLGKRVKTTTKKSSRHLPSNETASTRTSSRKVDDRFKSTLDIFNED